MSALFERAQKTKVLITSVPVTEDELDAATWLNLSCTIKQASFTAGQKNDIDVTTLCSE
ncbi:TPA: phage tail protein, partial [Klebsiella pneumoniae]|nr:phage tail protein [Klebsiella pneumoniae]